MEEAKNDYQKPHSPPLKTQKSHTSNNNKAVPHKRKNRTHYGPFFKRSKDAMTRGKTLEGKELLESND